MEKTNGLTYPEIQELKELEEMRLKESKERSESVKHKVISKRKQINGKWVKVVVAAREFR
jgi:hypothetical protein